MGAFLERLVARVGSWLRAWKAWRRRLARVPRAALFLVLAALVLLGGSLQGEPNTMLAASVETEVIEINVINPAASAFVLPRARLAGQGRCFEGVLVRPEAGSRLQYSRSRHGPLVVNVNGKAAWSHAGNRGAYEPATSLEFEVWVDKEDGATCNARPHVRLPIQGTVNIGSDLPEVHRADDRQLTLLSGKLLLYGRAVGDLFAIPLTFGPLKPGALYFSQEFPLPGGSRIASARLKNEGGGGEAEGSRWYGFADIADSADGAGAIAVQASTNARYVELYTPAPYRSETGDDSYRADTISLSLGARLTGDPNLLWIYGLVAVFTTLLGLSEHLRRTKE